MRILFAGLTSPYPPTNGHRLRTWAMVRTLADDGHAVTVASLADSPEPPGDLAPLHRICRTVEVVPPPRFMTGSEAINRLRALVSRLPYGAWKFRSPEFTASLERHLARERFDAVICDGVYNIQNLPPQIRVPVLLNKDDLAHVIIKRFLRYEPSLPRRVYGRLEAAKVRRWERAACQGVVGVLACSEHDRDLLESLAPGARVFVVPNVVDTDYYAPAGTSEPCTVLFQGGMDWQPNRDAVEFFITEILPELRRLVPAVCFRVAGRCPDEVRARYAGVRGVNFTARVPEMRDEIARAAVCVVPIRIGSGTRLKILEAAAMAKPIVSTSVGAEGLHLLDNEEIILADRPEAFARAVGELLGDEARRSSLGHAARLGVQKHYSLPALQTALRQALSIVTP